MGEYDLNFRASWWVPPSDLLKVLPSCCRFANLLTACLEAFLLDLACTLAPCNDRGSTVLG